MIIDTPYYEDMNRISNSNIGWYIKKGPKYLRDMLDGKAEGLSGSFLEKGTMIHMYILQPEEFWQNYTILDFEVPKSKQQIEFCKYYLDSTEIEPNSKLIKAYKRAYANSKTDIQIIKDAQSIIDSFTSYLDYLSVEREGTKKVISFYDLTVLKRIKENIVNHKKANWLLYEYPTSFECHNEFHINWEIHNDKIETDNKSLLDRVMFDHDNKKIIIVDLKTTADVYNFKHSVEEYDYYRQIAYYIAAVTWYMINELKLDPAEYELETYIIAIQNNGNNEVRVFDMKNEAELLSSKNTIENILTKITYHIKTGNWDHTLDYYIGDGTEYL